MPLRANNRLIPRATSHAANTRRAPENESGGAIADSAIAADWNIGGTRSRGLPQPRPIRNQGAKFNLVAVRQRPAPSGQRAPHEIRAPAPMRRRWYPARARRCIRARRGRARYSRAEPRGWRWAGGGGGGGR